MKIEKIIDKVSEMYSAEDILELLDYNNGEAENAVVDNILLCVNLSRNDLFELGILTEFEEWLETYTGCSFNK